MKLRRLKIVGILVVSHTFLEGVQDRLVRTVTAPAVVAPRDDSYFRLRHRNPPDQSIKPAFEHSEGTHKIPNVGNAGYR